MSNSVTVTDNRNGKSYEFPIYDGTILVQVLWIWGVFINKQECLLMMKV